MVNLDGFMSETSDQSKSEFKAQKRILSFRQFLDAFALDPVRIGRNAPQYVVDCFEHYGTEQVDAIGGKARRFKMFDAPFEGGTDKLIGHEDVQNKAYGLLKRFAATGRADRLVVLHGPNGSGKSSFIDLIFRALEHYSSLDEGTVFRFNWIFTERTEGKEHLGFGASRAEIPKDTLAFIDDNLISCKVVCELRENPIFLVPIHEREKLLDALLAEKPDDAKRIERLKGHYLREGDLSAKSKSIYEALLNAYRGDWTKVMRHIQVERYFISKRFRVGASVIEPQQAVDGGSRPMTFDHGLALPPALQGLQLVELSGELVEGCGGIVEYSDFLKRNIELNKYLLNTCERGTISLPGAIAHLNEVLFATCNEKYLSAFKANPDFTSFKGRMELIRAGYMREWKKEREIYREFAGEVRGTRHLAPHTLDVAALWAVMTRLRRPDPSKYPDELSGVLRRLTPLQKARLYGETRCPDSLTTEEKRLLLSHVGQLASEHDDETAEFEGFECTAYEGRRGASAREMRSLLGLAAQLPARTCLSPLAIFDTIGELLKDRSVYDFLRLKPDDGYQDPEHFAEEAQDEYHRWLTVEIYDSMELVAESEFPRRLDEYFRNVRAYVSKERIENPRTGKLEDPSEEVMKGVEALMAQKENADNFRKNLVSKVAAFSLEHLGQKLDYSEIFPDLVQDLRASYYKQKQSALETLGRYTLASGTDDEALIPGPERPKVLRTLKVMREKYGYCDSCSKEAINFVLKRVVEEKAP